MFGSFDLTNRTKSRVMLHLYFAVVISTGWLLLTLSDSWDALYTSIVC